MKKQSLLVVPLVMLAFSAKSQTSDLPPNAIPGKCYAKCLKPTVFEDNAEQYVSREASTQISVKPAVLGTNTFTELVREGRTDYSVKAPVFKSENVSYVSKEPGKRIEIVPNSGTYKAVQQTVMTAAPYTRYEIVSCNNNVSSNAKNGQLNAPCLDTVTERKLVREAYNRIEVIPASFKTVDEQILVKEASKRYEVVPATYKTDSKRFMTAEAYKVLTANNNVTFKTETERIMVRPSYTSYSVVPAQFKTEKETIMVREAAPAASRS